MRNTYFKWSSDFITGVDSIDSEHYKLVEIINKMLGLCLGEEKIKVSDIRSIYDELSKYTIVHFSEEEKLMEDYNIEKNHVELHKRLHRDFVDAVKKNFSDLDSLTQAEKLEESGEFLIRWLAYHILNTDRSLVRQIEYIDKEKLSPEEAYMKEKDILDSSAEPLLKALRALFYLVTEKNKELEKRNTELEKKVRDRTIELEVANRKLTDLSIKDELTGLPNRRFVIDEISRLIESWKDYKIPFSVIFIDLDKFKGVNDKYGHEYGDRVLKWVAKYLSSNIRRTDILARLGGDEFVIVCDHCSGDNALKLGEKINRVSSESGNKELIAKEVRGFWEPSFSIGVAEMSADIDEATDILKIADQAMYQSKKYGGHSCSGRGDIYEIRN